MMLTVQLDIAKYHITACTLGAVALEMPGVFLTHPVVDELENEGGIKELQTEVFIQQCYQFLSIKVVTSYHL